MTSNELVLSVVDSLHELAIPYMMVGSYSSNYYGIPRSTQDADFLVEFSGSAVSKLISRLAPAVQLDPQMSFETITGTWRYVARAADVAFKLEFFLVSDEPHDQSRFSRRRTVSMLGREVYIPSAEDVIITKLRWSKRGKRPKDLEDVKNVLSVQRTLDWDYLQHWCGQHGTRELLEQIRASLPPDL